MSSGYHSPTVSFILSIWTYSFFILYFAYYIADKYAILDTPYAVVIPGDSLTRTHKKICIPSLYLCYWSCLHHHCHTQICTKGSSLSPSSQIIPSVIFSRGRVMFVWRQGRRAMCAASINSHLICFTEGCPLTASDSRFPCQAVSFSAEVKLSRFGRRALTRLPDSSVQLRVPGEGAGAVLRNLQPLNRFCTEERLCFTQGSTRKFQEHSF